MRLRLSSLLCSVLLGSFAAYAHPGQEVHGAPPAGKMWPFERLPEAYLERTHGIELDPAWLEQLRLAALKIEGVGTASFVSPDGLVLTNHHCVRGFLARVTGVERDLDREGYYAATPAEELPLPGMRLLQLIETRDVSASVLAGVDLAGPEAEVERAIAENSRRVLAEARAESLGLKPRLVPMFRGARFQLYLYDVYSDVRLVFTPHLDVGYFGGSTDNFSYPHFAADFAFVRAYRDGQPVDSSAFHFRFSGRVVQEGESVFAVGNPGQADRHDTWAEVSWKHRGRYRFASEAYADMVRLHREYLVEHPERRAQEEGTEFSLVTAAKYMHGACIAFADGQRVEREAEVEQRWLRGLAEDQRLGDLCLPAFEDLHRTLAGDGEAFLRYAYQTPWYFEGRWFGPLRRAMWVLEALDPGRSEAERRNARRRALESWPAVTELEQRYFAAHLTRARATLGEDDPAVRAMLAGRTPSDAVRYLVEASRIVEDGFVRDLLEGGGESLARSADPAIVAARVLYPLHLANDEVMEQAERCMRANARRVGLAIASLGGVEVCPEPSFSLRLGDGFVCGYGQTGTWIPASNTLMGMFARAQEFPGHVDFELPELWRERMPGLDLATPFNFVCTIDATGGSSGSALLDRHGELVGVLYDGNAQFVENGFTYRDRQARSIGVHAAGMLEVLGEVYGAQRVLQELRPE